MGIEEANARPSWHLIYMSMAYLVAQRSLDPRTKHGCFVVAQDYSPLSFGLNSPPQGCDDSKIPLTSPEKYDYMAHAEENAISNAAKEGIALKDSIFYITGFPCTRCFREIRRVKATKIIYGSTSSHMITQKDIDAVHLMNTDKYGNPIIEICKFHDVVGMNETDSMEKIKELYNIASVYVDEKCIIPLKGK